MKKIFIAFLILFLFFPTTAHANSPSYCASLLTPGECNNRTGRGCEWDSTNNTCIYLASNIQLPVENEKASDFFQVYDPVGGKFETFGSVTNALLPYLLAGAGLILFAMLISGGFSMLTAATDPKKAEAGKQRITAAFVGFIIIFASYWLTQILEIILGISIL
jgi:hypothetical protein